MYIERYKTYFCIKHDGAFNTGVFHGGTKIIERFLMVLVRPMREIESSNIHTSPQHLFGHGNGSRNGSKSAHNLCFGPFPATFLLFAQISVYLIHFCFVKGMI
ncbi:hypothetical protein HanRHA438_Chr07g0290711 [Helianthus annuus]|nr:hypothetical protein HanRHA438_Chr07g0290711 [Helianthus annuus]